MTRFFIPHLVGDTAAAEAEWQRYLRAIPAPAGSRRACKLAYGNSREHFEVAVGERRKQFKLKTGPRGGHIPNADFERFGHRTGAIVSAIIGTADLIHVWCAEPPYGVWANPSLVGRDSVTNIDYFDDVPEGAGGPTTKS
jgi:hypothetical protein